MGLFDIFSTGASNVGVTRAALDQAREGEEDNAITRLILRILSVGIDGRGKFASASTVAAKALQDADGDVDAAIDKVVGSHLAAGAAGGFVTSLGGFVTMPVAIPANVFEFYVLATRMCAAVASLRGYDLQDPTVRTAVLLTLTGSRAQEILGKAGVTIGASGLAGLAMQKLPKSAIMVINKAIGFRLLKGVGQRTLARFGRLVPVLGGAVGAGLDFAMMRSIGLNARAQFPRNVSQV